MAAEYSGYAGPFCYYLAERGIIESTLSSRRGIKAVLGSEICMICIQLEIYRKLAGKCLRFCERCRLA